MRMKMKAFDCVAMKHKGAERVLRETLGMTRAEELAYWTRGTEELLARQKALQDACGTGENNEES